MADETQKASLFVETWKAISLSQHVWGGWFLAFSLLAATGRWFILGIPVPDIFKQMHEHPHLLKEHPEMASQLWSGMYDYGITLFPYLLIGVLVYIAFYYIILVGYLRFATEQSHVTPTVGGFFYWFSRVLWKYIHPILWLLIPLIGPFFYVRSTIRYAVVSPLAVLGQGPELENSWNMTRNNWWRIFWNQLGVSLVVGLIVWGTSLIPLIVVFLISHADKNAPLFQGATCLLHGLATGFGMMVGVIYGCTVCRVLLEERS